MGASQTETKGNKMLEMIKSLLGKGEKKAEGGCCGGHAHKAEEIKKAGGGCCGGHGHHHHAHTHEEEEDHTAPSGGCCGGHHKH